MIDLPGVTTNATAQAGTALSPEWDRGFDEAFTELISSDPDLVRDEFDALIDANFDEPPAPPAPTGGRPSPSSGPAGGGRAAPDEPTDRVPADPESTQRSPP